MSRNDREPDDPRDEHLLAALRHAPDREAAPPAEVTERILAEARSAARSARGWESHGAAWARLWSWFAAPRVGAAFGTLVVAGLVGLLWATREPPVLVPEDRPQAERPSSNAAPAPGAAADNAEPQASLPQGRRAAEPLRPTQPSTSARGGIHSKSAEAVSVTTGAAASAKVSVPETPSPPAAPPVAEAAVREQRASSDAAANAGAQGAGVAAPQPAAQRAMPTPESLERSRAEVTAATAAKLAAAPPRDPLADLDSVLRSPSDAAWQSAGRTIAHGTAQAQWWASLRASTQGRWQRTAAPREQPPPWLVLLSGGRVEVSLWFDAADGALWLRSADTYWKAPVPDEQRRTWQDTVARW